MSFAVIPNRKSLHGAVTCLSKESVASSALGGTGAAEQQVAKESTNADRQHNPTVVSHEQKPCSHSR